MSKNTKNCKLTDVSMGNLFIKKCVNFSASNRMRFLKIDHCVLARAGLGFCRKCKKTCDH